MYQLLIRAFFVVGACATLAGCATSRDTLAVPVPGASAATAARVAVSDARGSVVITTITDHRVFEDKPPEPSTPSLKGGASSASPEIRARAIARKRNGYGMALGDVLLPEGQTVTGLTRDLVASAFSEANYAVVAQEVAAADAWTATVDIRKFWSWVTPGMWTGSMEARLETEIVLRRGSEERRTVITGYTNNKIQVIRDANWLETFDLAMNDFKAKLVAWLATP